MVITISSKNPPMKTKFHVHENVLFFFTARCMRICLSVNVLNALEENSHEAKTPKQNFKMPNMTLKP